MLYTYFMTMRPPMPGAQPMQGLVAMVDMNCDWVQDIQHTAYAKLIYDRQLTESEIEQYELAVPIAYRTEYKGYTIQSCKKGYEVYNKSGRIIATVDTVESAMHGIDSLDE